MEIDSQIRAASHNEVRNDSAGSSKRNKVITLVALAVITLLGSVAATVLLLPSLGYSALGIVGGGAALSIFIGGFAAAYCQADDAAPTSKGSDEEPIRFDAETVTLIFNSNSLTRKEAIQKIKPENIPEFSKAFEATDWAYLTPTQFNGISHTHLKKQIKDIFPVEKGEMTQENILRLRALTHENRLFLSNSDAWNHISAFIHRKDEEWLALSIDEINALENEEFAQNLYHIFPKTKDGDFTAEQVELIGKIDRAKLTYLKGDADQRGWKYMQKALPEADLAAI